jgi:hypothetical protein
MGKFYTTEKTLVRFCPMSVESTLINVMEENHEEYLGQYGTRLCSLTFDEIMYWPSLPKKT